MRAVKTIKLVHPSHARTVLSETDAARLRQAGWLELADAQSTSKTASWQRRYRQRCKEQGMRQLLVWLPSEVFDALCTAKRPGESMAELLVRLVKAFRLIQ